MSDYAYKPRLGYDIRVRKTAGKASEAKRRHADASGKACASEGCAHPAAVRVAAGPRDASRIWLCAEHARQHNAQWNFFDGLSAREAEAVRMSALYGERPTWKMGKNERQSAFARARGAADFTDAFGMVGAAGQPQRPAEAQRNGRPLTKLQSKAFETLDLKANATGTEIRRRYAEMLRRFHPDANGGDRSAEGQLQDVVKAHHILKKAGFC
jgi:hypothetical protein